MKWNFRTLGMICIVVSGAGVMAATGVADADVQAVRPVVQPAVPVSAAPAAVSDIGDPVPVEEVPVAPHEPPPPPPPPVVEPLAQTIAPPAAPTTAPPAPRASPTAPAPTQASRQARVEQNYRSSLPEAWRSAIPTRLSVIPGSTSWGHSDGRIEVSEVHADSSDLHLASVVAHEFGHLIAFRYGTGAYPGAAPAGWPEATSNPTEHWSDCVQQVFTGQVSPSHGLPACEGDQLAWAHDFLMAGPPR